MDVLPVVLSLDLVLESDVLAVVAGVPVRGVEAVELADDMALVGDLVGDCTEVSIICRVGAECPYSDRQPGSSR
jgi:hypothetical protein